MPTWEHSLDLRAAPAEIFALLADPNRRHEWSPAAWSLNLLEGPAALTVGAQLRWKVRRAGLTHQIVTEVTALEPPHRLVEEQRRGPLRRWVQTLRLERRPEGGTRLTDSIDFEPPGGLLGLAVKAEDVLQDLTFSTRVRDDYLRRAFPERRRVAGIVLCGGQSRRMGRPKAWLPFGPEFLLPRVVRVVSEATDPVVVVAAPGQDLPPLPACVTVVRDEVEGRGPLQGLAAGFRALRGRADAAFVASCDAPLLHAAWIRRMVDLLGEHQVCVPRVGEFHHPLAAVYRLDVLPVIDELLNSGQLRPLSLLDRVPTRVVLPEELVLVDSRLEALRNVNTPEEYEAAIRDAGFAV